MSSLDMYKYITIGQGYSITNSFWPDFKTNNLGRSRNFQQPVSMMEK